MSLDKPSSSEEEYFAKLEAEKKQKLAKTQQAKISEEEKERLKREHWMRCPKCGLELQPVVFRGVTIDKCFHCGGVYLDDGELEKLAGKDNPFFQSIAAIFKGGK